MASIFIGVVAWLAMTVFSPASEANDQGVCITYEVVRSTFVGGSPVSRQYKVVWNKSTGGQRITFHQYPKFAGETESINSKTGEACKP